jgi:GT2 family glycosyltransferase
VIPTWNNLAVLQWCVDAVRRNSAYKHQIILHINDGSDGTLEWARLQPDIDYTYSPENIGICYAMNLAASLAATDYIMYLNDDMYLAPAWDAAFCAAIAQCGRFFFLSGTLVEPQNANFGYSPADFDEHAFLRHFAAMPKTDTLGACNPPNIVHVDVWNMVGGYSVEFSPGFGSDPDFVFKLWKLGIRHYRTLGGAVAYHLSKATTRRLHDPAARDKTIIKWGCPQRTLRYLLNFGLPVTPQNIALPAHIPRRRRILNKLKFLHCALRYLTSKTASRIC